MSFDLNNLSDSVLLIICGVYGIAALLLVLFFNRPLKPKKPHANGDHGHPFTIIGHSLLFWPALVLFLAAEWLFVPWYFPNQNPWMLGTVFLTIFYFAWPSVELKIQKMWAGFRGKHFHEHVPHDDKESDTAGKFLFWTVVLCIMGPGLWCTIGHCVNGGHCSSLDRTWEIFMGNFGRFGWTPGNWILIGLMAYGSRFSKSKLFVGTVMALWVFFVLPYIYGGYNKDPWDEILRAFNGEPPGWLQWLFPLTFA